MEEKLACCGPSLLKPPASRPDHLEVETQLSRYRSRRDVVCPAEGREEVVQRFFIRHIDHGDPRAPFVPVTTEEVIVTHREIEQIAGLDALWIVVVVFGAWSRRPRV